MDQYIQESMPLQSLFANNDPTYSFDKAEYSFLSNNYDLAVENYLNCFAACDSDVCRDTCIGRFYEELYGGVMLFSLEKHSRALFDPLYEADTQIFDSFRNCYRLCTIEDTQCLKACYSQLRSDLDREVENSLNKIDQIDFNAQMKYLKDVIRCGALSTQQEVDACLASLH
jgi:hypothetical protein